MGSRGIAYSFLTTEPKGSEGSASRSGCSLPPGKTRYTLYWRLGGHQGRSGQVRNISSSPGIDPRTVQPVASRYTDYATRPTRLFIKVKWSRYRPGVAHRVSRGVPLLFYDCATRKGVSGQQHAPATLYLPERPGTLCTGGWVGSKAGLDRCGKSRHPPGFDPRTVQPVASRYTDWATRPTQDSS